MKHCPRCNKTKFLDDFHNNKRSRDGKNSCCKLCVSVFNKTHDCRTNVAKNRGWRRRWLEKQFGITEEMYAQMLVEQGGVCAICHKEETSTNSKGVVKLLAIDHDHNYKPGKIKVRGLLCQACNQGIGNFKDDTELLQKAADYLKRHSAITLIA